MKLHIHDKKKVHEIQNEFSIMFPNLKLDFFTMPEKGQEGTHSKLLVHPSKELSECNTKHAKGELKIEPHMTAADLKKGFKNNFGLHVRVYRKVGDDWLETIADTLPLEKHNESAAEKNSENTLERI